MKPVEVKTTAGKTASGKKFAAAKISFPLFGYVLKRILIFIPTLFIISLLTFILISIAPGDPAETMLNRSSGDGQASNKLSTDKAYRDLRHKLGLDLPIFYFSFVAWVERAIQSSFLRGVSYDCVRKNCHSEINCAKQYQYNDWKADRKFNKTLSTFHSGNF